MRLILQILIVLIAATVLLYISRFWPFEWWERKSFLAESGLRPDGNMLRIWLRGTPVASFDLVIWILICFPVLSVVEKICQLFRPKQVDG